MDRWFCRIIRSARRRDGWRSSTSAIPDAPHGGKRNIEAIDANFARASRLVLASDSIERWKFGLRGCAMNSKSTFGVLLIVAAVLGYALPSAYCQGMGGGMGAGRIYNPSTETTVSGTVDQVRTIARGFGGGGTHLDLKTESATLDVHLGPSAYLSSKGFQFAKGDQVEVTGSKVSLQGHDAIIAREVKKGNKVLTLRNAQGIPEWAGGRRGGGPGMGRGGMSAPSPAP